MALTFLGSVGRAGLLVVVAAGAVLRALAVPPSVGDVDSVNFARGLVAFDPLHQAPHLPGYPVLMALAIPLERVGIAPVWALALPGILLFPAAALALFFGVRALLDDEHAGLVATALFALAPGLVLVGGWPTSDGLGLSLLALSLGSLLLGLARPARGPLAAFAFTLAMLLGARLSWGPLAGGLLCWALVARRDTRALVVTTFALGVALWLVPLGVMLGGAGLEAALAFGDGHLHTWGGTVLSSHAPLLARLTRASWDLFTFGIGVPVLAGVVALVLVVARARRANALLLAATPYALLAVLLQNVDKPRHFLPLVVVAAVALAAAWGKRYRWATAGLVAALAFVAAPRALEQGREGAPAARLVEHVVAHVTPERVQLFAGEEARLLEHRSPAHRVWRPASPEVLEREARAALARGAEVLVTSGAPIPPSMRADLATLTVVSGRDVVFPHDTTLALYRYAPPALVTKLEEQR